MVVCCGPFADDGGALCRNTVSRAECEALLVGRRGIGAEELDDVVQLPTLGWNQAVYPWIVLPICYRFSCVVVSQLVLRPMHKCLVARAPAYGAWVERYLGTSQHPTRPYPLVGIGVLQLLGSLVTLGLFICDIDLEPNDVYSGTRWLEIVLGVFFVLHWLTLAMKDEFVVKDSFIEPIVAVEMFTVPQLLLGAKCGSLSLGFLRTYRALVTYSRLEKMNSVGIINFWTSASDIARASVLTLLRFLSLLVIFAGIILVLEVLGDPPFIGDSLFHTSMGDVSFFVLFYWVLETISTVGYGDYAPKTVASRFVTMLCMVSGVLFFAIETAKFVEILGLLERGSGTLRKTKDHVVVLGSAVQQVDDVILRAFFSELYHPLYKARWPQTVVLVSTEAAVSRVRAFIQGGLQTEASVNITILAGNALKLEDLNRACCDSAEMIYILSDTTGRSGLSNQEEDKRNIVRALSVLRATPRTPSRLLVLRPDSKVMATSAGIMSKRCLAVNDLKPLLFWQSSRCIGWSTFVCNLIFTMDTTELARLQASGASDGHVPAWRKNYAAGLKHSIFGFVPSPSYIGKSFVEFVEVAFERTGMTIFAAQIDGDVILTPFHHLDNIWADTVMFAFAKEEYDLEPVACDSQERDWRKIFYRNRFQRFARDHGDSPRSRLKRSGASLASRRCSQQFMRIMSTDSIHEPLLRNSPVFTPLPPAERSLYGGKDMGLAPGGGDGASLPPCNGGADSTKRPSLEPPDTPASLFMRSGMLRERAKAICAEGADTPFVTFIELAEDWEHAAPFIEHGRNKWLPTKTPIIVQCRSAPSQSLCTDLGLEDDPTVGCIVGSPTDIKCLSSAGVLEAAVVLCPAVDHLSSVSEVSRDDWEEASMVDAEAIVVYKTLDGMGVTLQSMVVFELKRVSSASLLPACGAEVRWHQEDSEDDGQDCNDAPIELEAAAKLARVMTVQSFDTKPPEKSAGRGFFDALFAEGPSPSSFQAKLCFEPLYISGRVFTSACIGSMLARGSYVPGIAEVIEALIMPQQSGVYAWQIHARESMVGRDWSTCWKALFHDHDGPALALGIYRFLEPWEQSMEDSPPSGFVFTSPSPGTFIRADDLIYVLASEEWGHRAARDQCLYVGKRSATASSEELVAA